MSQALNGHRRRRKFAWRPNCVATPRLRPVWVAELSSAAVQIAAELFFGAFPAFCVSIHKVQIQDYGGKPNIWVGARGS
jgi:hypothetical protein